MLPRSVVIKITQERGTVKRDYCDYIATEIFSALDVLDYILQLLFGIHVEGLPRLYCCQLQRKHKLRKSE